MLDARKKPAMPLNNGLWQLNDKFTFPCPDVACCFLPGARLTTTKQRHATNQYWETKPKQKIPVQPIGTRTQGTFPQGYPIMYTASEVFVMLDLHVAPQGDDDNGY